MSGPLSYIFGVALEGRDALPAAHVPQPRGLVSGARREGPPVGAEAHARDLMRVPQPSWIASRDSRGILITSHFSYEVWGSDGGAG